MLKKSLSTDSWEFPWDSRRNRRSPIVPQSQSGRNVTCIGFIMCFLSVLLLSCGVILLGVSLWSLLRKIPYTYLIDVKVDVPYFSIPASFLCFPSFWISMAIHNKRKKYEFLHLLILLLVISIAFLIAGTSLGFLYLSRINLNTTAITITASVNPQDLNATLITTLRESRRNVKYAFGWEKTQAQLRCCGVKDYNDWLNMNITIPESCCVNSSCTANNTYREGCLDILSRDLFWNINILNSQCYMVAIIQANGIILAVVIYIIEKRS